MSRDLSELLPVVRAKAEAFIANAAAAGIELLVTCTYRSPEEQAAIYAQGRTQPGAIVTSARPGDSFHNYRVAFDVVPLRGGKPVWGTAGADGELWRRVGALGEAAGLEWSGRWAGKLRETAHFQYTGGKKLQYFRDGGML